MDMGKTGREGKGGREIGGRIEFHFGGLRLI